MAEQKIPTRRFTHPAKEATVATSPATPKPYGRFWQELDQLPVETKDDERREYSADYDRVLYSTAFRRLSYVTPTLAIRPLGMWLSRHYRPYLLQIPTHMKRH